MFMNRSLEKSGTGNEPTQDVLVRAMPARNVANDVAPR